MKLSLCLFLHRNLSLTHHLLAHIPSLCQFFNLTVKLSLSLSFSLTLSFCQFSSVFFYSTVRLSLVFSICLHVCQSICSFLSLFVCLSFVFFSPVICLALIISQLLSHSVFRTLVSHSCLYFDLNSLPLFLSISLVPSPCLSFSLSMNLSNSHTFFLTKSLFLAIIHLPLQLLRSLSLSILLAVNLPVKL